MRRNYLSLWAVLLLALALAIVFAAGCGDKGSGTSSAGGASPSPEAELTAQEIVDQSEQAMQDVNSASFTADVTLKIDGDPAAMTDPMAQQMLSKPISVHVEGSSSTEPMAADMEMTMDVIGQNLAMGVLAEGEKAWVQYNSTWYEVPQESAQGVTSGDGGALPTEQLEDLGLDPQAWDVEWELVGTETVDGADVYHVSASPDPKQMAADLMKALSDPELYEKLGDPAMAEQLKAMKSENANELKELQRALESVTVDLWVETESLYLRKGTIAVGMDMTGMKDAEGVKGMSVDVAFTMADFDEPVEVEAPAKAQDFDQLMQELVGGMMGGGMPL